MEIWYRQKSESEQPTPNLDQKENRRGVKETVKRALVQQRDRDDCSAIIWWKPTHGTKLWIPLKADNFLAS
jgi:hypothetical protein